MNDPHAPRAPGPADLMARAVAAWRRAQVVYRTPSWEGEPEASARLEEVAGRRDLEAPLIALLADPDQRVVAYALLALDEMGSEALSSLPDGLLTNRSNISLQDGSFRTGMDLGSLARSVQKRAREAGRRRADPGRGET